MGRYNYFVTANSKFTRNAYLQPRDARKVMKHGHFTVRIINNYRAYKSARYNKHTFKRNVRKGAKLNVHRIVTIGTKGEEQTRLQLTNGLWITANKNFVKVI